MGAVPHLHEDELAIDRALVRRLVNRSLPQYAGLDVRRLESSGSSNALFRLGDDLLVRLPRQPGGSTTIEKEARWLPVIARGLTAAVPEVVAVGDPGFGYPEKWALTTWLDGHVPAVTWDGSGHGSSHGLAEDLARFVIELHGVDVPPEARVDPALSGYRGGRLEDLDDDFRQSLVDCESIEGLDLDLHRVLDVWVDALAAERSTAPVTSWLHGDLLSENLLTRGGELAAVLDFGGLLVGEPSVDLVVAWEVLDSSGRETFRSAVAAQDAQWAQGRGWAVFIAVITLPYYWDSMRARCLDRCAMAGGLLAET